jgi:hypothetical protein
MLLQREKSQVLMVDIQEHLLSAMAQPGEVAGSGANLLEGGGTPSGRAGPGVGAISRGPGQDGAGADDH